MYYIMTADGWRPWLASHKVCDNHNKLEGVFVATSLEDTRKSLTPRIDRFLRELDNFHPVNHGHKFRGDHYIEPLFGAYGEKL